MVFFTCNGCGESLKKGQVDKHAAMCRNCQCLSCIDCGKDFWGEDYKNHLKCISEDQKYGGKAFEAKANKGDVKQQQWIQRIQEVMKKPSITPNLKNILTQVSTYDNIPRKKAKFQNWMKNSLKIHNQALQDQVWEIFSEATSSKNEVAKTEASKSADMAASEGITESEGATEENNKKKSKRERKEERQKKNKKEKKNKDSEEQMENGIKKKGKKRKLEDEDNDSADVPRAEDKTEKKKKKKHEDEQEEEPEEGDELENTMEENEEENRADKGKFNWKGTIKALLRQAPDNELPIKKLRKKVISQYYAISSAQHKSEEELLATFNKKIRNNPKFRVLKERVKLIK
ncbi:cell growth-regulating nucleolar protein [Hyperolius riggenbachi]|uniref:cell growth-regulating nucleolar protein n=1 Tax=Hyperolius riggenbachi TaxID=752182 RepID=UPI0035A285CA